MAEANSEMEEQIKTVLKIKDFYQLLGVSRDSEDAAIKNAYKKMALKFHPDKNKCASAREAFNKVSNAYTTLIDKDKRASYDRYGSEEDIMRAQANRQQQYYQQQAQHEDHFDEFDFIFRQFFGGMQAQGQFFNQRQPRQQYQRQAPRQHAAAAQQGGFRMNIIQILFLFGIAMTLLPKLFETKPYFSLEHAYEYNQRRNTAVLRIPYYVRSDYFEYVNKNDAKRQQIDQQVEQLYLRRIYNDCEDKKLLKRKYLQLARQGVYNREAYGRAAEEVDLSSCTRMQHFQTEFRQYLNSLF